MLQLSFGKPGLLQHEQFRKTISYNLTIHNKSTEKGFFAAERKESEQFLPQKEKIRTGWPVRIII